LTSEAEFLRLETVGRRTGMPHTVLLRYATLGQEIIVFPSKNSTQDWVMNVQRNSAVKVHTGGKVMEGDAKIQKVKGLDDVVLSVFSRKYGDRIVRETYWGATEYLRIDLGPEVSREDLDELIYLDLEAAFDGVAEEYDKHIFGNPINVWLRNRSVALMLRTFRPGQTILEVGCGTGTETLSLAKEGIRVVATDVSSKMLTVLQSKATKSGLDGLITPIHCRPHELVESLNERGIRTVDGAYSTYGAVNTDPRLPEFFENLHSLIAPGGSLILGVWNKFCAFEILGYLLKAKPAMAFARLRNPVPVGKSRFCVSTNAFSVRTLSNLIRKDFILRSVHGVGVFLPPSNLTRYLPPAGLMESVKKMEVEFEGRFPWNRLGDHYLGVYSRVN
jgi:deazaflavin-dependent oxidoreductase (nitroreductase family)